MLCPVYSAQPTLQGKASRKAQTTPITINLTAMKKFLFSIMFVAAAVMTLGSCAKEQAVNDSAEKLLHFTVRTAASKTYISEGTAGAYAVGWHQNDEIGCFTGAIASGTTANFNLKNQDADGATATFDGAGAAPGTGTFTAVYPASAIYQGYKDGTLGVEVKSTQAPSSISFDTTADILVSQACGYTSIDGSSVTLNDIFFSRILSVVRVNVKGTDAAGQKISSLKITAPSGTVLTGRAAINMTNRTISQWTMSGNTVEGKPTEDVIINDDTFNAVYLLVNPTTIAIGSTVTISGSTNSHDFSKTITVTGKDLVFPAGQIAVLNITISSSDLSAKASLAGEYIMTGVSGGTTYAAKAYAGTDNNIKSVEITETDATNHLFTTDQDDLKITLTAVSPAEVGGEDNYYTIQDANDYYLYVSSSSDNYLKGTAPASTTLGVNYYFSVVKESDGTFTIKADKSSYTRNLVRFNSGANPKIFSCYASGQNPVTLYPYANLTVDTTPQILSVSPASLTWTAAEGTASKTITVTTKHSTGISANVSPTDDFTIQITDGDASDGTAVITVTPKAAAGDAARNATLSITASDGVNTSAATDVGLTQQSSSAPSTVTDVLTLSTFGVTGTSYKNVSGKQATSPAVYSANLAGGNSVIQLRSTSPSGIISTTSGGNLKSVKITFHTATSVGRQVDVYGKTVAYTDPVNLYSSTDRGTLISTAVYASGTLTYTIPVTDSYQYIGIRSNDKALWLESIEIEWEQ